MPPKQRSFLPPLTQAQRLALLESLLKTRSLLVAARSKSSGVRDEIRRLGQQFESNLRDLAQEEEEVALVREKASRASAD